MSWLFIDAIHKCQYDSQNRSFAVYTIEILLQSFSLLIEIDYLVVPSLLLNRFYLSKALVNCRQLVFQQNFLTKTKIT